LASHKQPRDRGRQNQSGWMLSPEWVLSQHSEAPAPQAMVRFQPGCLTEVLEPDEKARRIERATSHQGGRSGRVRWCPRLESNQRHQVQETHRRRQHQTVARRPRVPEPPCAAPSLIALRPSRSQNRSVTEAPRGCFVKEALGRREEAAPVEQPCEVVFMRELAQPGRELALACDVPQYGDDAGRIVRFSWHGGKPHDAGSPHRRCCGRSRSRAWRYQIRRPARRERPRGKAASAGRSPG